jgi:hypothetical protein
MPAVHYMRGDRLKKIFRVRATLLSALAHYATHAVYDLMPDFSSLTYKKS